MRQALHILKKDLRYLRYGIASIVVLSLMYGWVEARADETVYPFLAMVLVGVVAVLTAGLAIHAEAVPGDKQFWVTRPYRWQSLLMSKLLFIVLFVNLPIFAGRLLIVVLNGIPLLPALPGLFWSQFWLLLAFSLPVAALGAVTAGVVPFLFLLVAITAFVRTVFPELRFTNEWPQAFEWVRSLVVIGVATAGCSLILYCQYRGRHTRVSRLYGALAMLLTIPLYAYLPPSFAFAAQSRLSPQPPELSSIQVQVTPSVSFVPPGLPLSGNPLMNMDIAIVGVPGTFSVQTDAVSIDLEGADGRHWNSGWVSMGRLPKPGVRISTAFPMDPAFLSSEADRPLTMRVSTYLTLFGNPRQQTVQVPAFERFSVLWGTRYLTYRNVIDDLQCSIHISLRCRSVSTLSSKLVTATAPGRTASFRLGLSYAPVPMQSLLDPIEDDYGFDLRVAQPTDVVVVIKERLANIRRDFEATNIRLKE